MKWTLEQEAALKDISTWLKAADQQVYRLFGYAGTGKTTLAKEMRAMTKDRVVYASLSGKAASVLDKKGCTGAQTIHSLIYRREEIKTPIPPIYTQAQIKAGKVQKYNRQVIWTSRLNDETCPLHSAKLLVLDEVSMVGDDLALDLLEFGVPILAIGDPAQLRPVDDGAGYFTHPDKKPNYMLREIHRQAKGNPIIDMATTIRKGESLAIGHYGESEVARTNAETNEVLYSASQIVCGTNKRRQLINRKMRKMRGQNTDLPVIGDKIICLANNRSISPALMNGTLWSIEDFDEDHEQTNKITGTRRTFISAEDDTEVKAEITLADEMFDCLKTKEEIAELRSNPPEDTSLFDYGYAITVHKAQGSQWDNVAIVEDCDWGDDHNRWLYTAITRAAKTVTLIKR